jgi:hypothetical protein
MVAANPAAPSLDYDAGPAVAGRIGFDTSPTLRPAYDATGADRRCHPRQELSLRLRGRRLDHDAESMRQPFLNLSLRDVSVGGLRATSQTPLKAGERVAVFFPPHGPNGQSSGRARGWDAYGRVIRVEQGDHEPGCTVAVAFDTMSMAA